MKVKVRRELRDNLASKLHVYLKFDDEYSIIPRKELIVFDGDENIHLSTATRSLEKSGYLKKHLNLYDMRLKSYTLVCEKRKNLEELTDYLKKCEYGSDTYEMHKEVFRKLYAPLNYLRPKVRTTYKKIIHEVVEDLNLSCKHVKKLHKSLQRKKV